jgi:hypothetical protein
MSTAADKHIALSLGILTATSQLSGKREVRLDGQMLMGAPSSYHGGRCCADWLRNTKADGLAKSSTVNLRQHSNSKGTVDVTTCRDYAT